MTGSLQREPTPRSSSTRRRARSSPGGSPFGTVVAEISWRATWMPTQGERNARSQPATPSSTARSSPAPCVAVIAASLDCERITRRRGSNAPRPPAPPAVLDGRDSDDIIVSMLGDVTLVMLLLWLPGVAVLLLLLLLLKLLLRVDDAELRHSENGWSCGVAAGVPPTMSFLVTVADADEIAETAVPGREPNRVELPVGGRGKLFMPRPKGSTGYRFYQRKMLCGSHARA